jgi:hypothetical protein
MIEFKKYPHVRDLILHYANVLNNADVLEILNSGVKNKEEAYLFSRFVLLVIDSMAKDMQDNVMVMGSADNTSMIPDIDYEMSLYLARKGLEDVWDEVCNEE